MQLLTPLSALISNFHSFTTILIKSQTSFWVVNRLLGRAGGSVFFFLPDINVLANQPTQVETRYLCLDNHGAGIPSHHLNTFSRLVTLAQVDALTFGQTTRNQSYLVRGFEVCHQGAERQSSNLRAP
jgi:hypothetical protein